MADARRRATGAEHLQRRRVLQACCGLALCSRAFGQTGGGADATTGPQLDDALAFAYGARAGQIIGPADVALGAKQLLAYPFDNTAQRMRDSSRLNQLIVVRLDPAKLAPETATRAADGIVAYSGVCTHTGCDVVDWYGDVLRFKCPCHESEFDPGDSAKVVGGPAPWPLAALPLKLVDGALRIAGPFVGRVGFQPPGLDPFGPAPQ